MTSDPPPRAARPIEAIPPSPTLRRSVDRAVIHVVSVVALAVLMPNLSIWLDPSSRRGWLVVVLVLAGRSAWQRRQWVGGRRSWLPVIAGAIASSAASVALLIAISVGIGAAPGESPVERIGSVRTSLPEWVQLAIPLGFIGLTWLLDRIARLLRKPGQASPDGTPA